MFLLRQLKKIINFNLEDLGFSQQVDLFNMISNSLGKAPPVIDADELCLNPRSVLISLCSALGIDFDDEMLMWNTGSHSYDGLGTFFEDYAPMSVPDYQRGFDWNQSHVEELWEDLHYYVEKELAREEEEFFIGTIIL